MLPHKGRLNHIFWNNLGSQVVNYRQKVVLRELNHDAFCDRVGQGHLERILTLPANLRNSLKLCNSKRLRVNDFRLLRGRTFLGLCRLICCRSHRGPSDFFKVRGRLVTVELQSQRAIIKLFRAVYFYFSNDGLINWMLSLVRIVENDSQITLLHVLKVALQSS